MGLYDPVCRHASDGLECVDVLGEEAEEVAVCGGGEEGEKVVCRRGLVISTSGTGTGTETGTLGDQAIRRSGLGGEERYGVVCEDGSRCAPGGGR